MYYKVIGLIIFVLFIAVSSADEYRGKNRNDSKIVKYFLPNLI